MLKTILFWVKSLRVQLEFKTRIATYICLFREIIHYQICKIQFLILLSSHFQDYHIRVVPYASVPLGIFASAMVKCIIIHAMLPDALRF